MRIIRGTDFDAVREGDWSSVPTRFVSRKHAELKSLADNDIVIETAGGSRDRPTGRTLFLKPGTIASQDLPVTCASFARFVRLNPTAVDPNFVYWWLQALYETRQLLAFHTQHTGVARFQWTTCSRSIRVPNLDTSVQRKIAVTLSAYDDLIENNNRRIKLLEQMAQRIYREWFVEFRFPGHKGIPLVDSDLGQIPEGWRVEVLNEVLTLMEAGSRPKGGIDPSERGVPSVGAENVLGLGRYDFGKEKFVSQHFFEHMKRGRITSGDVVLYKDGAYIGRVSLFRDGFPHLQCGVNEHVFVLRANERYSQSLLYFWLAHPSNQDRVRALNANAAQPGLNQEKLRALPLVIPSPALVGRFTDKVEPLLGLLFRLALAVPRARATRDFLLPRLISGGLDVTNLDIDTSSLVA